MPAAVAGVVVGLSGFTAATVGGVASLTALGALTYGATYAASVYALNKAANSLAKKGKQPRASLEATYNNPSAAGEIVYGNVRKGGVNVIPPRCSGNENRYLHQVIALAIHESATLESVGLDDDEVLAANITSITSSANDGLVTGSSKYASAAWLRWYAGTTSQNVDFILNAAFPSNFGTFFRGRGITYLAATFDWGKGKVYTGGIPTVTVQFNGKKCYDPRLDVTPGASPTNPSYIAHTENPALVWADYMMSQTYGKKVASAEIDWDSVVDAADDCDALVNIPGPSTQKRYTFNGVLSADADAEDNERQIIDAMMGKKAYTDGKHRIFAGAWRAAAYEIDREDWIRIGAIQTTAPRGEQRFNGVVTYYTDADRNFQRVESYRRYNDTYKSADAGERIWVELEQPHTRNRYEAERKGEFLLRQSRNGIKLTGVLPPRFMRLRTWDNVALYFDELGWSGKTFTCASVELAADGSVEVSLIEEQDTDWTDLASGDYGTPSVTDIPATNPTSPTAPASFSVTPLLGTLRFDFEEPVVRPKSTQYQILRSPGTLAVAGSYSVIWEGAVTQIMLPADVRSLFFYHGRCVANSFYSALSPTTFGLGTAPYIPPESVPGNRGYPDGELYFADARYWREGGTGLASFVSYTLVTSGGMTNQRGRLVLSSTSGSIAGDRMLLTPLRYDINSRTAEAGVPMIPFQSGIAYITARRVTSFCPGVSWGGQALQVSSPKGHPNSVNLFDTNLSTSMSAATSGDWLTFIQTFTMPGSRYDHFSAYLRFHSNQGAGGLEIGAMQVAIL